MESYPNNPFPTVQYQASFFTSLSLCFLIYKTRTIGLLREVSELKQRSTWLTYGKCSTNERYYCYLFLLRQGKDGSVIPNADCTLESSQGLFKNSQCPGPTSDSESIGLRWDPGTDIFRSSLVYFIMQTRLRTTRINERVENTSGKSQYS